MKALAIFGISLLVVLGLVYYAVDKVPPDALTRTRMIVTEQRIRAYVEEYGRLPQKLSDLPKLERSRDDSFLDGRGKEIIYVANTNGTVALISHCQFGTINKTNIIKRTFRLDDTAR